MHTINFLCAPPGGVIRKNAEMPLKSAAALFKKAGVSYNFGRI
jgi:hypothetical protein